MFIYDSLYQSINNVFLSFSSTQSEFPGNLSSVSSTRARSFEETETCLGQKNLGTTTNR
jgi:hypothetical protein